MSVVIMEEQIIDLTDEPDEGEVFYGQFILLGFVNLNNF